MRYLISLAMIVILSGCATAKVVKEAIWIDTKVVSGEVEGNIKKADLSVNEEQIVTHAINSVAAFRERYGAFIGDPATLLSINPINLAEDYQELRERFSEVENIVANNYHEYDSKTQEELNNYKFHAYRLDNAIMSLLEEKKYRVAIKKALSYGFTTLQLVASLKP